MSSSGAVRASAPSLRLNVVANYAGKLWAIASVYIFVPVYIHILGMGAYGLIAFHAVALAVLFVADAGMSATFSREAARLSDRQQLLDLLASIERVLLGAVGAAGLAMLLGARYIATSWLDTGQAIDPDVATDCMRLMPLALVPQIILSLYQGGLMGLQRQVRANALATAFSFARSGLVVLPIYFWPDPRVFFAWQALVGWVFVWWMRAALRQTLSVGMRDGEFSWPVLKPVLGYAAGMFAMSVIAGINTQLDRLVVSKLRPLDEFTLYSLAATLAQIPSIIATPIVMALLPRLTMLREQGQEQALRGLYQFNSYVIAALSSVSGLALVLFANEIVSLWMYGRAMPASLEPVIQLLALGGLFLALQLTPFQLSLAHGHNRTNVRLGTVVLLVTVPLQVLLTTRYGLTGAAVPWLLLNAFAFFFLGIVLNARFNAGHVRAWFVGCTLTPVLASAVCLCTARLVASTLELGGFWTCAVAVAGCLLALTLATILWPVVRRRMDCT